MIPVGAKAVCSVPPRDHRWLCPPSFVNSATQRRKGAVRPRQYLVITRRTPHCGETDQKCASANEAVGWAVGLSPNERINYVTCQFGPKERFD